MVSFDPAALFRPLPSVLHAQKAAGGEEHALRNVVAASAEGYAFPTNLDRDQPIGGLAPETQAELVWRAVQEDWSPEVLDVELTPQAERYARALWGRGPLPPTDR